MTTLKEKNILKIGETSFLFIFFFVVVNIYLSAESILNRAMGPPGSY